AENGRGRAREVRLCVCARASGPNFAMHNTESRGYDMPSHNQYKSSRAPHNRLHIHDFNFDQNNRYYDFFHNQA
ncbi:hypothetical protein P7M41_26310, partial [Vibrio parahaemolyticus]|nr:hypothetical protein [Vibrio parahaemolyticus]